MDNTWLARYSTETSMYKYMYRNQMCKIWGANAQKHPANRFLYF